jgi:hypothetical protein
MAKSNLKQLAEELEKTLAVTAPPKKAPAPKVEQAPATPPKSEDLGPVVRAVVEYSLNRATENGTPAQIGEAIGLGIQAAAIELNIDKVRLAEALDIYMDEVVEAALRVIPG